MPELAAEDLPELKASIERWATDPVAFVREVFGAEPDGWQAEVLRALLTCPRIAMQACKGPGKSCVMAWAIWWFLVTREDAEVVCVSITGDNLRDNLWKELALWHAKCPLLDLLFHVRGERIEAKEAAKTWWCSARSFPQDADAQAQKSTLAGFHGKHCMVVLDEAGGMPVGVLVAAEGIFANKDEAILVMGGNPDTADGALYEACVKRAHRFKVVPITGDPDDPNHSPRVNVEQNRQWIEDWGRDNPWVMVNVLGQFPPVGANKLLGPEDIRKARQRHARKEEWEQEPRIGGLDIAAGGLDESSLTIRQGPIAWDPKVWREDDLMKLADIMASLIISEKLDALFVLVAGLGLGVYNRLVQLGYGGKVIAVHEAESPSDPRFFQVRDHMWWEMAQWVKRYGCLPDDPRLAEELIAPTCEHKTIQRRQLFKLEDSKVLKARLGHSPDRGTSLAATFAAPVAPKGLNDAITQRQINDEPYQAPWERRA